MARLRLRLIRFGDRDGLGTSEATRTRGRLPSVAAGARTDTTWQSREIVGIRNWVLGAEEGIGLRQSYRSIGSMVTLAHTTDGISFYANPVPAYRRRGL